MWIFKKIYLSGIKYRKAPEVFKKDCLAISKSGLFDKNFYLYTNPDIKTSGSDPILHFVMHGWREGRNPNSGFNTSYYLKSNSDIRNPDINPLVHYILYGRKEGRPTVLSIKESFKSNMFQIYISDNPNQKQIFLDISTLVRRDDKTGIQRVVRSIIFELLKNPPIGYRIAPVYSSTNESGYRYAMNFVLATLNYHKSILRDKPISFSRGDIFLGLDLCPEIVPAQEAFFQRLRDHNVYVVFLIYDLLSLTLPFFFSPETKSIFTKWLKSALKNNGAVCISKTVRDELTQWILQNNIKTLENFKLSWFRLGSDFENSTPSLGLPKDYISVLSKIESSISFLMVGTIEPRKGYIQIFSAFERLWKNKINVNLVIVGKRGWMMDNFIERINASSEFGKQLFWMDRISDEYLEKIYTVSSCLIAASEGEGFGLPIIEAANHKLPIIARDIPVFREVAQEYAYYFDNTNVTEKIADAIDTWLDLYKSNNHPKPDNIKCFTWKESTKMLILNIIPK